MTAPDIVERLREEAKKYDDSCSDSAWWFSNGADYMNEAADEIARLQARVAELEKDAARYRWLLTRDPEEWITDATGKDCWSFDRKEQFDAAIDAAREG